MEPAFFTKIETNVDCEIIKGSFKTIVVKNGGKYKIIGTEKEFIVESKEEFNLNVNGDQLEITGNQKEKVPEAPQNIFDQMFKPQFNFNSSSDPFSLIFSQQHNTTQSRDIFKHFFGDTGGTSLSSVLPIFNDTKETKTETKKGKKFEIMNSSNVTKISVANDAALDSSIPFKNIDVTVSNGYIDFTKSPINTVDIQAINNSIVTNLEVVKSLKVHTSRDSKVECMLQKGCEFDKSKDSVVSSFRVQ